MKHTITLMAALGILAGVTANAQRQHDNSSAGYPISPVPFTSVKVTDSFWGQRLKASREVTIPLAFSKCEETGRYRNFQMAAHPSPDNKVTGYSFDDTDVYKTIEGASYLLQTYPDEKLKRYIDSVLVIVAAAQEPDGYLYTARTMNPDHPHEWAGSERWEKVEELSHEFYNLGHMIEGAIAHYQATGQRNFLDIAIRYADCVCREIGPNEGQLVRVPGHQIAEMALAKLYVVTGDRKYLDEAKFFLDMRGRTERRDEYSQAHKPVVEQDEAVGHAVRAAYMYSGMADVAALTGDTAYVAAIERIWDNVVGKKLYITGGIGATNNGEAFGANYELPNMSAYCETCAAIGNVYWNYRLFLMNGESKYYDVLERTLYNGVLSGISLDGGSFFYPNPLESMGQHQRSPWFGCACCPSNACRFIPSVPGYIYAVKGDSLYVNLFIADEAEVEVGGTRVGLRQTTSYPWQGDITLDVTKPLGREAFLRLIGETDIFIEASKGGQWERWGLDDETLWKVNPQLVIAHITGYGQTGLSEYTSRPSYDPIAQAFSGLVYSNGNDSMPYFPIADNVIDYYTALFTATGCLSAYINAQRTGRGESLDVAQYECGLRTLCQYMLQDIMEHNPEKRSLWMAAELVAGTGSYRCREGSVFIMSTGAVVVKKLAELLGIGHEHHAPAI